MGHDETTSALEMRWAPVTTTDGRTRMEATWIPVDSAGQTEPVAPRTHAA